MGQSQITRAQSIGRKVRAALAEVGKTQADVSRALGLTQDAVSRRIVGRVAFRGDELMQLAEYLGVDPGRFLQPICEPRSRDEPGARLAESEQLPVQFGAA